MEETKVLYHVNDEETPYLVKLPISSENVSLGDLKNALSRPNYKYFFKSMDDDFGVVKEEIVDDAAHLPCFNGRVVCWLVATEGSSSDTKSQCEESQVAGEDHLPMTMEPQNIANGSGRNSRKLEMLKKSSCGGVGTAGGERQRLVGGSAASVNTASDIESTSVCDSDDDDDDDDACSSRLSSTATEQSDVRYAQRRRHRHQRRPRPAASSISSITDSSVSLNVMTVILNMDRASFLGISVVGQSNKAGDGGIYVGSIMKGGAVALDGRIEPGDMILEVNGVSFENLSNDEAVRILRDVVQKSGQVKLVVAKCWDASPRGYFLPSRGDEPIRPIDPSAWVAHTEAVRQEGAFAGQMSGVVPSSFGLMPSFGQSSVDSSPLSSVVTSHESCVEDQPLTVHTDMVLVARAMSRPDSGLEIRDRLWLKITIPRAFIGCDLVNWLHAHVQGLSDRREARKYAGAMLHAGLIRHTVNKTTFSEQCYYTLGDVVTCTVPMLGFHGDVTPGPAASFLPASKAFSQLTLEDVDSVSESGNAVPRRDVHPRLPMSYSSWLTQFNTNPYGPSNVGHMPSNVGHIPQSPRQPSDAIYAPPPPYNVVTAGGAKIVVPSGCGSFSAACRSIKDPVTGRSRSGSSASGSSHSQSGGGGGRSGSTGSCHKPSLICVDDVSEHCSLLGTHQYSLNGRTLPDSVSSLSAVPQLLSSQHASSLPTQGLNDNVEVGNS